MCTSQGTHQLPSDLYRLEALIGAWKSNLEGSECELTRQMVRHEGKCAEGKCAVHYAVEDGKASLPHWLETAESGGAYG